MKIKNIGIVGFGLIGGSMGLAIKKYTSHNVYAFDNNQDTVNYIRENNLCDGVFNPDDEKTQVQSRYGPPDDGSPLIAINKTITAKFIQ
jgi:6-phosphogluconate dehydrogenase (decarboxylating)